jgi:Ca2+-transporting ATPase
MNESPRQRGLFTAEAVNRLATDGPNALPTDQQRLWSVLLEAIREPMFLLLIASAILYLALGDLHEGLLLLFMVSITIGLTLYQEGKTERALAALRDLSSPRALVLRDGEAIRIPGREVVRGDWLILSEGDRVPADATLIEANNLQIDESLLTGEAWPVGKRTGADIQAAARPGGDDLPFVWSGTLVVRGDGVACVTATGPRSEIGKIGGALQQLAVEPSPLQRETARTVKVLATAGVALSVLVAGLYGIVRGEWLQAILVGIALSMSLLPEEYPVILAVFPAIGAWRLSRVQVLTRRLPAIETLGSISVLCTDKTGTLTENRMHVVQMQAGTSRIRLDIAGQDELSQEWIALAETAALASKPQAVDPMEQAFHRLAEQLGVPSSASHAGRLRKEYPLTPALRAMSLVWQPDDGSAYLVAAKGAPEAIANLCCFGHDEIQAMRQAVDEMAKQGLRILAAARAEWAGETFPESQTAFRFRYLGLLALVDPIRQEIPEAVCQCREAGIRVIMITGDYPGTADSIARQAGLPPGQVLSGDELDTLDDIVLAARLRESSVCARITPQQKLRIVQALKANGEIVAMTGDGVNDAPALKAAHVGIAMGGRGTDVAREAASLVLLDDNFASIVRGIRLGRRIFANMQDAMSYVLAMHVPIAGMALLPALFGWPILLYPMQIAFLELIIDPACSLAFENEASDADAMRRLPRSPHAPLLGRETVVRAVLQGCIVWAFVGVAYLWALNRLPPTGARAMAFAVLVIANLALIFSTLARGRSVVHAFRSSNRIPLVVAGVAIVMLLVTLYVPTLAVAFDFSPLTARDVAVALGFGLLSVLGYELVKFATRYWRQMSMRVT